MTPALAALDPGVRWEENRMVVKPYEVEEDLTVKDDKRTFKELEKIAASVYKCLDFYFRLIIQP